MCDWHNTKTLVRIPPPSDRSAFADPTSGRMTAGDTERQLSPDRVLAHPDFATARRAYVHAILDLYENSPFLNRLLIEIGRTLVFQVILCLNAAYDETRRETWPTMGLIQRTMEMFDLSSARRIHDIVWRLMGTGFVVARTQPSDRRVRILTPTDKMMAHDRDWLAAHYEPLDILFPDPGHEQPLHRDEAFQKAQRMAAIGLFAESARQMRANPIVTFFMTRDAGMMILMKIIQWADEPSREKNARLSFSDLGNRFGVSRTHVRVMLHDAERMGLLVMSDHGITLTPVLLEAFDRFVANGISGHNRTYRSAMRTLAASPRTGDARAIGLAGDAALASQAFRGNETATDART